MTTIALLAGTGSIGFALPPMRAERIAIFHIAGGTPARPLAPFST